MRLAVYAICKNEERHVQRFWDAVVPELRREDELVIVDTGSTDGTLLKFRELIQSNLSWGTHDMVSLNQAFITPWRFDHGRNVALAHVDLHVDACWSLDLDEIPQVGWRDAIERNWKPELTRLRYKYVWSWNDDGSEAITYYGDKLHARADCSWRLPAHEYLKFGYRAEKHEFTDEVALHHHPDKSKPRDVLKRLELAYREEPNNPRVQHYLAREYFFNKRMKEAKEMFERHLSNPESTWRHERSESMLYLTECGGPEWFGRAVAECPERRETWMLWAEFEKRQGNRDLAYGLASKAVSVPEDKLYISDARYRGDGPQKFMEEIK